MKRNLMAEILKKEYIKSKKGVLGYIDYEKGQYVSFRDRSHMFHKFGDGFGLSLRVLDYLEKKGISIVVINFRNWMNYVTTTGAFLVHGEDWDDNGDMQLILSLSKFNRVIPKEIQTSL